MCELTTICRKMSQIGFSLGEQMCTPSSDFSLVVFVCFFDRSSPKALVKEPFAKVAFIFSDSDK